MVDNERVGSLWREPDANRDRLIGEAGSHPTGQPGRPEGAARRIEVRPGLEFDDSEPAYRYGWESATLPEYRDREFEEAERDLERGWPAREGASCEWPAAREPARRAWERARREGSVSTQKGGDE